MFCLREKICCTAINRAFGYSRFTKDVKVQADLRVDTSAVNVNFGLKPSVIELQQLSASNLRRDDAIVAEAIELRNRLQEIGSKLLEELAYKTNEKITNGQREMGIGAESSIGNALGRHIAKESFEKITSGASPTEIRRGVMLAVNEIKKHLKDISRPVSTPDDIAQVAGVYAGDKSICNVVCEAIKNVRRDGVVYVRRGKSNDSNYKIELIDGMRLNSGYISPYFINTMHGERIHFQKAVILLISDEITSIERIMPAIELARSKHLPLLIIANGIDSKSLRNLVIKRLTLDLRLAFVKTPGLRDTKNAFLKDIAITTGGEIFGNENNMLHLENIQLKDLGKVSNVIISKDHTLLINCMGKRNEIDQRVEEIKEQISDATTSLRKRMLRERLMNLISSVVLINVGGSSEKAVNEKIQRINEVLEATRIAMEEGIVPGAGIALLKCISCLDTVIGCNNTQRMGIDIVRRALRIPSFSIALNAGIDPSVIELHLEDQNEYGYDMLKGEFGSFIEMGLIEPTKLVRTAIEEAAGVTSLLTKAEALIAKIPQNKKE